MGPERADAKIRTAPAGDLIEIDIQRTVAKPIDDRALARAARSVAKYLGIVGERKLVTLRRPITAFAAPIAAELFAIPNCLLCGQRERAAKAEYAGDNFFHALD